MTRPSITLTADLGDFGEVDIVLEPNDPITTCEIYRPGGELMSYGLGVRKEDDEYDLETGCRMAFMSAYRRFDGMFDDQDRAAMWQAFLKEFPPEKRRKPEKPALVISFFGIEALLEASRSPFQRALFGLIE